MWCVVCVMCAVRVWCVCVMCAVCVCVCVSAGSTGSQVPEIYLAALTALLMRPIVKCIV